MASGLCSLQMFIWARIQAEVSYIVEQILFVKIVFGGHPVLRLSRHTSDAFNSRTTWIQDTSTNSS